MRDSAEQTLVRPKERQIYFTLLGAIFVFNLGLGVFNFAVSTYLVSVTGSTEWFFWVLLCQGLGQLVSLPFAGKFVQQSDPLKIYRAVCGFRASITLGCFLSTYFIHWPGTFCLFALAFGINDGMQRAALFGSIHANLSPARERSIIGYFGTVVAGGNIGGTIIFGIVAKLIGVQPAIGCDSVAVILLFLVLSRTLSNNKQVASSDTKSVTLRDVKCYGASWLGDIRTVLRYRYFFLLLLLCGGDFVFSYALTGTIPALAKEHFGGNTSWITALGLIYAGAIVAGSLRTKALATRRLFILFSLLQGAGALVLSIGPLARIPAMIVLVMITCGLSNVQCITFLSLSVQGSVALEAKPRASSLRLFTIALAQVTIMPVMAISGGISLSAVYTSMAAIMCLFAIGGLAWLRYSSRCPERIELAA